MPNSLLCDSRPKMHSEDNRWNECMATFMAGDEETLLLRFDEVGENIVNKGYWLKFDPHKHAHKVARLNWLGQVVGEIVERTPNCSERFKGKLWFVTCTVLELPTGCSYYNEDGDPFDPENAANWDGDQQIGFRD